MFDCLIGRRQCIILHRPCYTLPLELMQLLIQIRLLSAACNFSLYVYWGFVFEKQSNARESSTIIFHSGLILFNRCYGWLRFNETYSYVHLLRVVNINTMHYCLWRFLIFSATCLGVLFPVQFKYRLIQ